jgi:hypothetical protein
MGWAGGSRPMRKIIETINKEIDDDSTRTRIYRVLIDEFENEDWDTQGECLGIDSAFDQALRQQHPDWEV